MKKILLCIFCVVSMCCSFVIGFYYCKNKVEQSGEQVTYKEMERVAIVNLDEGVQTDGEKVMYSSKLLNFASDYVFVGLNEAKKGLEVDMYAAYIVIPSDFSKCIASINGAPEQAQVEYVLNAHLSDENRLSIQERLNGEPFRSYSFSAINRMTSAIDANGNISEYYYNSLGYRIGMRHGKTKSGLQTKALDYGNGDLLTDMTSEWFGRSDYVLDYKKKYNNVLQMQHDYVTQNYFWDDELLFMKTGEESYCYLADMQGSVTRLLNQNGQIVASYGYDEFGQKRYYSQTELQPFGYTGYQWDKVSRTYYAQVREYDSCAGRFISEDPIGYARNWYTYCSNNPLFYIDPIGLADADIAPQELEEIAEKVRDTDAYKIFVKATQSGALNPILAVFDFKEDSEGVYHTDKRCWQRHFGYNDMYDYVFDVVTSMDRGKYDATTTSGETYIIWMWKGDYTNLGAGAETGIYENGIAKKHWIVELKNSVPMTLSLYDKDGGQIYDYRPDKTQWWITGFHPDFQDVEASDLTAVGTIDLSGNDELWEAFYNRYKDDKNCLLCFDKDSKTVWYRW